MNYLFHNYPLVLPELPGLRKMQGKAPFDTRWKTPLPGHPSPLRGSHQSQHRAHLEHELCIEGRRHAAPQRQRGEPSRQGSLCLVLPGGTHESCHMAFVDGVSSTAGWQGQTLAHTVQKQGEAVVQCNGTFAPGGT